jgi:diguanylate cyclase (GGDEF)-like protein
LDECVSDCESKALLAGAMDALGAPTCVLDSSGTILVVNQSWRDFAARNGGSAHDPLGQNYLAQCDAAGADVVGGSADLARGILAVLRGELAQYSHEYPCHSPTEQRWFSARVYPFGGQYAVIAHVDITNLQRTVVVQEIQKKKLQRLQDLYSAITEADQIIDTSSDMPWLFSEVCRIAVDLGGMQMAWVAQPDPSGEWLVPLVSYGTGTAYLDGISISTQASVPEGRGPTGTAFRENRATINQAGHIEFNMLPWRERIESFHWQSSGTFPVRQAGRVIALLSVYSTHANAFGEQEVELLEKLAANLSQAAEAIENRKHQHEMEQQLRRSEETYRTLFETVHQGVVFQDGSGAIRTANPAAERILGLTLAQMQGRTSVDSRWGAIRADGSPFPGDEHPAMQALAGGQPVIGVVMGVVNPCMADTVWIQINATPVKINGSDAAQYVYSIFDDISENMRLQRELQTQANWDFLTEVANRRRFFMLGQHELTRAARYASETSLLMLDIDHFKVINDTHGHTTGDVVLKTVAKVCRDSLREADILGRIGGEEFAVLLPQTAQAIAHEVAERIRLAVQESSTPTGSSTDAIRVTVSIGVASCTTEATLDEMLRCADGALYQAKHSGRNKVCSAPGG